jgi:hypothetical protein
VQLNVTKQVCDVTKCRGAVTVKVQRIGEEMVATGKVGLELDILRARFKDATLLEHSNNGATPKLAMF